MYNLTICRYKKTDYLTDQSKQSPNHWLDWAEISHTDTRSFEYRHAKKELLKID